MGPLLVPTKDQLWFGSILGGIVHAVVTAKDVFFVTYREWQGRAYAADVMDGRRGVVLFENGWRSRSGCLVGLFFDPKSKISPYHWDAYDLNRLFRGMPQLQHEMATQEIRRHLLVEHEGRMIPEVTSAFWSLGNQLQSSVPWTEVLENGSNLIEDELNGADAAAVDNWKVGFKMSDEQIRLVVDLFRHRLAHPGLEVVLEDRIVDELTRIASDAESLSACEGLLASVGLLLPERDS